MKRISAPQVATMFTGCFLGAGFLSGQELLQFFARFGGYGVAGMALAVCAFCGFGLMVLRIAKRTGFTEFDRIVIHRDLPRLRGFLSGVFLFFLFGVMVSMIAGAGALLHQLLGLPALAGNAIMSALVLAVALSGAAGLVASFSVVVPLLVIAAAAVGVLAFLRLPAGPVQALPFSGENPLLGNWFFSALSFISYNMMAAVSILVPLTGGMEDGRTIHRGMALGAGLLTAISACILLPMVCFRDLVGSAELPMLALAGRALPALGAVYALLLFCGMFTAALSALFAVTSRLQAWRRGRLSGPRLNVLLCLLAFGGSVFGFKNMISFVYPVCGYIGFLALAGIAAHALSLRRQDGALEAKK